MISIQANRTSRIYLACTLAIWLGVNAVYIGWEAKPPFVDVFLFKEAGVNLALEGKFVAANLPHMPPEVPLLYAYYAPVYPFLYGAWTAVTGVGLKQSILFDHLIKGARTLLLFLFITPWLIPRLNDKEPKALTILGALLCLSFLPYYNDRPDELAIVFGLLSWWLLSGPKPFGGRFTLSGICLGVCAATSPAASILFGLGSLFYFLKNRQSPRVKGLRVLAVIVSFSLCFLPVFVIDHGAWSRFSAQLPLSVLPYQGFPSGFAWLRRFGGNWISTFWFAGKFALLPFLLFFSVVRGLWPKIKGTPTAKQFHPYVLATAIYAPLATIVWSQQPRYLWFPCITAFLLLSDVWLNVSSPQAKEPSPGVFLGLKQNWLVYAVLTLAIVPGLLREGHFILEAFEAPDGQSSRQVRERVLSYIASSARLAVPADQFFTFRSVKEVAMAYYVCPWLDRFDYVYLTPGLEARDAHVPLLPPCREQRRCFSAVKDFRDPTEFTVLGFRTSHLIRSNAGVLFKNTKCLGKLHAQNT